MNPFKKFNNKEYCENLNSEIAFIIRNIRKASSHGPFVTYHIAELIYSEYKEIKQINNEIEIKKIILQAITFFKKAEGRENEIYTDLLSIME